MEDNYNTNYSFGRYKMMARYREAICRVYVSYMLGICKLYVGYMLDICWVYVGYMLGICWIYVGYIQSILGIRECLRSTCGRLLSKVECRNSAEHE